MTQQQSRPGPLVRVAVVADPSSYDPAAVQTRPLVRVAVVADCIRYLYVVNFHCPLVPPKVAQLGQIMPHRLSFQAKSIPDFTHRTYACNISIP